MSANTTLKVAELDYFSIRENLKDFLKSQDVFADYDFEGSGMSVLLDILSYNTYYNNFYLNMVANESYLDTAQLRQNMLSLAKSINYFPKSKQGAMAKVNIRVVPTDAEPTDINTLTLEKNTMFIGSSKNGKNYPFVTVNSNNATKIDGVFSFANVVLKQGEPVTLQFPVNANNTTRKFQIPSANVDATSLSVIVQESPSNTYTEVYKFADDLTTIKNDSTVYFLEEDPTLNYTLYFGDNVIGKRPKDGSIVVINYLETVGSVANNIVRFSAKDPIGSIYRGGVVTTTSLSSYGGSDKETVEQIRFRAPHSYTTQNRAVTRNDYEALLTRDYQNIDAVSVWGGEENDPPVYGKVYMSIKTKNFYSLTNLEKEEIKNDLILKRNVLTVVPEIVDPNYTFILIKGTISYNATRTTKTSEQIGQVVTGAVSRYNSTELNTFKSTFRKSRLQFYMDSSDPSITGSDLRYYLQKRVTLNLNETQKYIVDFNTPIQKGTVSDKLFTYPEMEVFDGLTKRFVNIEETPSSFTGVDSIQVNNPGYGYESPPTVTITGDGSGAKAEAVVVNRRIESINITNRGSNYTSAIVSITSPTGVEAAAVAILQSKYGTLRTYYYNDLGEKVIVNANAGTIDYERGKIVLTNLLAYSVKTNPYYGNDVLAINVLPDGDMVVPVRNRIISIDEANPQSIQIKVVAES